MKLRVKIEDQTYEVEIDNLHARPVIAFVNGEPFEVWPEESSSTPATATRLPNPASLPTPPVQEARTAARSKPEGTPPAGGPSVLRVIRAPIPGLITSISVNPGDEVTVGQQLCILEAMKMNNSIRASRSGRIGVVHVTVGQHVKHNDTLVEFAE